MPDLPVHHQLPEFTHSCPLSRWYHPTISSSVIPFSSRLQSFPASGSFLMSQLFASGGQSIGVSASASVLPMNVQDWFPLGWTGWISLMSTGLSRVFSSTTVWKHQFFDIQPSLTSIYDYWKCKHLLFFFFFFTKVCIHFRPVLGLSWGTWGSFIAAWGVLSSCGMGLSYLGACGILVPRPEIEPMSPALEGGFLTIGPPGKSHICFLKSSFLKTQRYLDI